MGLTSSHLIHLSYSDQGGAREDVQKKAKGMLERKQSAERKASCRKADKGVGRAG